MEAPTNYRYECTNGRRSTGLTPSEFLQDSELLTRVQPEFNPGSISLISKSTRVDQVQKILTRFRWVEPVDIPSGKICV